jgi:hypothetical protein
MKRLAGTFLVLAIVGWGGASLSSGAQESARGHPLERLRTGSMLTAEEEEQDAREIAALINEAVNVRRVVTIQLHNDTTVVVGDRVTVQRYWLIVPQPDRAEIRFRASMIASVKIR